MYSLLNTLAQKSLPSWIYQRLIARWDSSGIKRYASNTLWALIARIFNTLTSLFVTIYLVRYLGPTNYGELSYAISFIGLFSVISTLGIENVLYRDLIKYPDQRNLYLGTTFLIRLCAGILASATALILGFYTSPDDVSLIVIALLSLTFVFTPFSIIVTEFQANVAQKYPSFVTIAVVLILNLLKLGVIFSGEGVLYIACILLLEPILYAVFLSYIRVRYYGSFRTWRFNQTIARKLLIDSWPFIFIAVFITLYSRVDQIMLKHLIDSTAVGVYSAALRLAEAWFFIPLIIASSLFPAIINAKSISVREYRDRLLTLVYVFVILAILVAAPLSFFSKHIITLFYGPAFSGSAIVFAIYVWVGVGVVIDVVIRHFLIAENMRKTIFFVTAGAAVLNTLLNLLLIPVLGPAGAAWSTLISYVVLSLPIIMIFKLKGKTETG